jgi:hypothetical protein
MTVNCVAGAGGFEPLHSESEFAKTLSLGGGIRTSAYRNRLNGGLDRHLVASGGSSFEMR